MVEEERVGDELVKVGLEGGVRWVGLVRMLVGDLGEADRLLYSLVVGDLGGGDGVEEVAGRLVR